MKTTNGAEATGTNPSIDMDIVLTLLVFSIFTFLFNFVWEILQAPLFARMPSLSHWEATLICLKATLGDVGIALASYVAGAWWITCINWYKTPNTNAVAAYVATGVLITIVFEWYSVYWAGRWAYSGLMPIIPLLHVGLAPVLQWFFLPPVVLYFLRRHDFAAQRRSQ